MGGGRKGWVGVIAAGTLALTTHSALAELTRCETSIHGEAKSFVYDAENMALRENTSRRERLLGAHGAITCPGFVTLRAMTPELDDLGRAPFCLQWDRDAKTYIGFAEGARDAWVSCRKPSRSFCQRVNGSTAAARHLAANATDLAYDIGGQILAYPAGTVVLQGQGTAIGGYLVDLGSVALGNPVALGAVAVTAVAVGGAVYVCSDDGAKGAAVQATHDQTLPDGAEIQTEAQDARLGADLPATSPDDAKPIIIVPPPPKTADEQAAPISTDHQ
ncbi:hypothetical protein [Phaeovulum sp.]|uniref:hypothetical protein n=1 Tax=Phaeovulum sp. TaxID=2934796 RepID=UPI0039E7115C